MMEFKDVQNLKEYLNKEHQGSRIKFATKVFHVLNFTKEHPESINICGAAWCNDGAHFICNANIMAGFLNLRSNSINTNFRDHGFRIDHSSLSQVKHDFPHLMNIKNWKMRSNTIFAFKYNLNVEEIEKIPCTSARPSYVDPEKMTSFSLSNMTSSANVSAMNSQESSQNTSAASSFSIPVHPYPLTPSISTLPVQKVLPKSPKLDLISIYGYPTNVTFLIQSEPIILMKTSILYTQMNSPDKHIIIERIARDWINHFGNCPYSPIQTFNGIISGLIGDANDAPQLTTNALFLLHKCDFDENSSENSQIAFNEFMNFVLHYGFVDSWVETLLQLSAKIQTDPNDSSGNSSDSSSDTEIGASSNSIPPNFHSWFQPWFNKESALRLLSDEQFVQQDAWFIAPSEDPMLFNLFYKWKDEISVTDIFFNPLDNEKKLSVNFDDSSAFAPNWGTLLYTILKLDSKQRLESSTLKKHLNHLDASKLTMRSFQNKKEIDKSKECLTLKNVTSVDPKILRWNIPLPLSRRILS